MFRNPVQGPRIVPFLQPRTTQDVLPNGHPGFRVTQRFGDRDAFGFPGIHGAMDIGNFWCGDKLLAMKYGTVQYLVDPNGALGIQLTHRNGWKSQIWHLSRFRVADGSVVRRGKWIADVGSTGLDIGGCHAHVVAITPQGKHVDIWPLLDQNQ